MSEFYQLDQIDREILYVLDKNARASATQISQQIGVSKQRVSFRIRKMIKLGILDLFSTVIAKTKLGYFHCQTYLKLKNTLPEKVIFERLKKIPALHWVSITKGDYTLVIFMMVKSLEECWKAYQKIIDQFSDDLIQKEILLSSTTYHLNYSYITGVPKRAVISEFPRREVKLKQRDFDLINAIKENGRIQINQLAQKIGSTPYTVRQRIAYLKRKGIIQAFKVRINTNLIGFRHFLVLFSLSKTNPLFKKQLIQDLIQDRATHRIVETIGKWDLICDLILKSEEKAKDWLKKILTRNQFARPSTTILEIKKILPINTVVYS